jgi:hypothetical protein
LVTGTYAVVELGVDGSAAAGYLSDSEIG